MAAKKQTPLPATPQPVGRTIRNRIGEERYRQICEREDRRRAARDLQEAIVAEMRRAAEVAIASTPAEEPTLPVMDQKMRRLFDYLVETNADPTVEKVADELNMKKNTVIKYLRIFKESGVTEQDSRMHWHLVSRYRK